MSADLGDFVEDSTVSFLWSTNDGNGASITRSTDGTIHVYKDVAGGTEVTTGITNVEDFDSLVGIHSCTIDLSSAAFYATGADYTVVLKAAVIDTQTVNAVLARFSIENRVGKASGYAHEFTLTDDVGSNPIPDCLVWVTSDEAGTAFLYSGYTDEFGVVTFNFTSTGTYWFWKKKAGVYFGTNPEAEVVS